MKKYILAILCIGISFILFTEISSHPIIVSAWGDSDGGRPSYSLQEIDENAEEFGNTPFFNSITIADSDYAWYKNKYGESMPTGLLTHEKNYVGAREDTRINLGKDNVWAGNEIDVEDGKVYIIRMYVHNNNPNGWDAVAENTRVHFSIPTATAKTIKVNGFIDTDNASPKEYVDYVNFNSDHAFHLEYVPNSALIENNGKVNRSNLDKSIVNTITGTLIGYDALDGKLPGGYQYSCFVSIRVKAVFDEEFFVEQKVRVVGNDDKEYKYAINAKIGDIIEIQLQYKNTSSETHYNVAIRDILPKSLQYIEGSTKLYNSDYRNGAIPEQDNVTTNGVGIGDYAAGANAYLRFRAKIVGDTMAYGANELVNWGQVQAGADEKYIIQQSAKIFVTKVPQKARILSIQELLLIAFVFAIITAMIIAIRKAY